MQRSSKQNHREGARASHGSASTGVPCVRRVAPLLCLLIALVQCGTAQKPAWVRSLRPEATRFKVQVLEIPGYERTVRLEWSERFAARFRQKTGLASLLDDEEIRRALLARGQLVPSFNHSITTRFLELGEQKILTFTVQNLETGAILASTRIRAADVPALVPQLSAAADALLESD